MFLRFVRRYATASTRRWDDTNSISFLLFRRFRGSTFFSTFGFLFWVALASENYFCLTDVAS